MTLFSKVQFDTMPDEMSSFLGHWSWVYVHNNFPNDYTEENHLILYNPEGDYTTQITRYEQKDDGTWTSTMVDYVVEGIPYKLYSPATADKVPLVVWLHGSGESGTDNRIQIVANRVTAWIEPEAQALLGGNTYVLAPQTAIGWGENMAPAVIGMIENLIATKNIDPDRVYIGGCSMGGFGTWTMLLAKPELFAGAFPICGGTGATDGQLTALVGKPIWLIHAVDDGTVNVQSSIDVYNRLRALGSDSVHMTLFEHVAIDGVIQPYLGHWSWVYAHNNFPYEGMSEYMLLGKGLTITDPTGTSIAGITSEAPADTGYGTFMEWLADQMLPADVVTGDAITLEAEAARIKGGTVIAANGGFAVSNLSNPANSITFRFALEEAGAYRLSLLASPTVGTAVADAAKVLVNGAETGSALNLPADSLGVYSDYLLGNVWINRGENSITIISKVPPVTNTYGSYTWVTYSGFPNLDRITLTRNPDRAFDVEMKGFDWGQNVIAIHIDMGAEISADAIDTGTFNVTANGITYFDYGMNKDVTASFPRAVESVAVNGSTVTLRLLTDFNGSTAAGNVFADYSVVQVGAIGELSAYAFNYGMKEKIDALADRFERRTAENGMNYRLFVPDKEQYAKPVGGYPIVVWLHGGGEYGTDNHKQISANRVTAWADTAAQDIFMGAYIFAPQNHSPEQTVSALTEVLDEFADINRSRIYIGGCSMGGRGTWQTLLAYPDLFAAAFPICAAYVPTEDELKTVRDVPIWILHSVDDNVIGAGDSISAYRMLKELGAADVHITLFSHVEFDGLPAEYQPYFGHWSWVYVHNNFPYESMEDQLLYGSNLTVTDGKGNTYTDAVSQLPSDYGYETFMQWLAGQKIPAANPPVYETVDRTTQEDSDEADEETENPFTDIAGHWAEDAILTAYADAAGASGFEDVPDGM